MIAKIQGRLLETTGTQCVVQMQEFALQVEVPLPVALSLIPTQPVQLWTHLIWREDGPSLYGFVDPEQKKMFQILLKVNGVGPKLALMVLSKLTCSEVQHAIQSESAATLQKIPGVGGKTAQRIIIDLKDRFKQHQGVVKSDAVADATEALLSLGYKMKEVQQVLAKVAHPTETVENIIRSALGVLAQ